MIRNGAYTMSTEKYNMTVQVVKNKIKSLRSYFSKEHQKVKEKKSAAGTEDKYDSPGSAYSSMLFILDSIKPRATKNSPALITVFVTVHFSLQTIAQSE
nr:unnamed protein product [Callosobruchus analis]